MVANVNGQRWRKVREKMIEIKMPEEVTQEPCDDCISREAVDEYITNLLSSRINSDLMRIVPVLYL